MLKTKIQKNKLLNKKKNSEVELIFTSTILEYSTW